MGTRGLYRFIEEHHDSELPDKTITIYSQYDNYPEGALEFIKNTLSNAWELPRFEADEFSAAFVSANKDKEGGYRIIEACEGIPALTTYNVGEEYIYDIKLVTKKSSSEGDTTFYSNDITVTCYDVYSDNKPLFTLKLEDLKDVTDFDALANKLCGASAEEGVAY